MQKGKKYTSARELLSLNLVRLRKDGGLSQEKLALEAGVHRTFVTHVERQVRNASLDNIEKLANGLGVPVGELVSLQARVRKSKRQASARELLAFNLVRLRGASGLSQDEVAAEAGLDRTFVTQVELQGQNISLDNVEKLAVALCVPVEELLRASD